MPKYLKVMFGTTSGANSDVKYKLNDVTVANTWVDLIFQLKIKY